MNFLTLPGTYSVLRFPSESIPSIDFTQEDFVCLARTGDEVSVVCRTGLVYGAMREEGGWRVLKIQGPIDFGAVGVLAVASGLLAAAGLSIFALSTFDTDYILVKEASIDTAVEALERGGHHVEDAKPPAGRPFCRTEQA